MRMKRLLYLLVMLAIVCPSFAAGYLYRGSERSPVPAPVSSDSPCLLRVELKSVRRTATDAQLLFDLELVVLSSTRDFNIDLLELDAAVKSSAFVTTAGVRVKLGKLNHQLVHTSPAHITKRLMKLQSGQINATDSVPMADAAFFENLQDGLRIRRDKLTYRCLFRGHSYTNAGERSGIALFYGEGECDLLD